MYCPLIACFVKILLFYPYHDLALFFAFITLNKTQKTNYNLFFYRSSLFHVFSSALQKIFPSFEPRDFTLIQYSVYIRDVRIFAFECIANCIIA